MCHAVELQRKEALHKARNIHEQEAYRSFMMLIHVHLTAAVWSLQYWLVHVPFICILTCMYTDPSGEGGATPVGREGLPTTIIE